MGYGRDDASPFAKPDSFDDKAVKYARRRARAKINHAHQQRIWQYRKDKDMLAAIQDAARLRVGPTHCLLVVDFTISRLFCSTFARLVCCWWCSRKCFKGKHTLLRPPRKVTACTRRTLDVKDYMIVKLVKDSALVTCVITVTRQRTGTNAIQVASTFLCRRITCIYLSLSETAVFEIGGKRINFLLMSIDFFWTWSET